ncbi:MAG: amino acid ABC transporter permease [Clostridiales bacterium]|nr:amino acid ABC transporter permease [Clostridiales bacterium]
MFFQRVQNILANYGMTLLRGAGVTLLIATLSTFFGCIIGYIVGIIQTIPVGRRDHPAKKAVLGVVRAILRAYVEVFRGTPMMVQAGFIYYGFLYAGVSLPWLAAALLIVSINTGAYMAETVRGGILSIDEGQTEGAKAIGMTHFQTMLYVILPQATRNILPQIGNNLIINIKDTCVLSVISIVELFFAAKTAAGATYTYFEPYTISMVMYLIMTLFFSRLLRWMEKKMDGPQVYDLATTDTLAHTSGMISYPGKGRKEEE